tara:strand:+ start:653 stop:865 length:213 start_codon:yes stop_codon:yes gene_type:complete
MNKIIHEDATNKVYARIVQKGFDITDNKTDILRGTFGPITRDEMVMILRGNEKELAIWEYLMELLDKEIK